uniref:Uncharacterized protein n=1 Tax=Rhizophora mucronata TaxID=61149 RepID=A0A2P2IRV7_RHIMU
MENSFHAESEWLVPFRILSLLILSAVRFYHVKDNDKVLNMWSSW